MIDKNTIYSYFQTDDFPTEDQFRATWDSFWHKSESIPMSQITGLNQLFQQTATVAQLNDKANVDGSNIDVSAYQEKLNITNLIATAKEEVKTELLNGAPEAFDTLKEISDWISDDGTAEAAILQAIQNEATARTNADNLLLNKPTATSNSTSYPYVVGEDGNGGSARLPAGDLGKNFFNADLSNTTARNHTMNAAVTVNTLGNPHTLAGLPNKNIDIANFRKIRVQNTSGLDAVVDSKNLLTDGVISMSDAEKDAWRLAQRKTGENYSLGAPQVDFILPKIIKNDDFIQYISIYGLNLLLSMESEVKLVNTSTNIEYLVNNIQTFASNPQTFVIGYNFNTLPTGTYRLKVRNGILANIDTTTFTLVSSLNSQNISLDWEVKSSTGTTSPSNNLTSNSLDIINESGAGVRQTAKSSSILSAVQAEGDFMLSFNININRDTYQMSTYFGIGNANSTLTVNSIPLIGYLNNSRIHYLLPTSVCLGTGQDNYLKGNVSFIIVKQGALIYMIENVGGDIKTTSYQLLSNYYNELCLYANVGNSYNGIGFLKISNIQLTLL